MEAEVRSGSPPYYLLLSDSPCPCSHDVPLQHGLLAEDAPEVVGAQVDGLKPSVQDELGDGAAHGGRVLQPVSAETRCEVHVVDQRVQTYDAVLVEGVVVVIPGPCSGHLIRNKGFYLISYQ